MKSSCKIAVLYSGSKGNSTFIRLGQTCILIDAGKNAKALRKALEQIGESVDSIDGIFITHEHRDHTSALEVLLKKNSIPVYITDRSASVFDKDPDSILHKYMARQDVEYSCEVGMVSVSSFRVPHDSRMNVGYRIEYGAEGERQAIGYATDMGYVSDEIVQRLSGCEIVILEANHDIDMLMSGPYPYDLKVRVSSKGGHLSNDDCASLAATLAQNGTKLFVLAHLSEENNDPQMALDEVQRAVECYGARVLVSDRERITLVNSEELDGKREAYNPWNA